MSKINSRLPLLAPFILVLGLFPGFAASRSSDAATLSAPVSIPSTANLTSAGPALTPWLQYGPASFVNFETPHVHPLDLAPGFPALPEKLLAVNTAEGSLLIFSLSSGLPVQTGLVMVGTDPVTVRTRSATEAWVVNRISNTISVVDLQHNAVTDTFDVCHAPGDVVFPSKVSQAIVSCTRPNLLVAVDVTSHAIVSSTPIVGESPRSLAVSPDGSTVYVGIFESGTPTTVLEGDSNDPRINNVTENPAGPWRGTTPVSNNSAYLAGTSTQEFIPALNSAVGAPPPVATIVAKSGDGYFNGSVACTRSVFGDPDPYVVKACQYQDPNSLTWINCAVEGGTCTLPAGSRYQVRFGANGNYSSGEWSDDMQADWTSIVTGAQSSVSNRVSGWDLPDHDVAIYNVSSGTVKYQTRLMNAVMSVSVNPGNSQVYVVGTDATNYIRFQPILDGKFLHVDLAYFPVSTGNTNYAPTIVDLNPQIDYTQSSTTGALNSVAIGDPRGIAWQLNGSDAFVTGMGSNNVVKIDAKGNRVAQIPVGQGPTGIVLDYDRGELYVLNKFDSSITTLSFANSMSVLATTPFFDPTPNAITAGRPFLYNTHLGSGNGQIACGSCHIDAKSDRLTWDLGDPSAADDARDGFIFHPMKGPMATMTLQNIIGSPSLHHRGDRADLFAFAPAFQQLQGLTAPMDTASMTLFQSFLATVTFPPNPNRDVNNAFGQAVSIPGPLNTVRGYGNADNQAGESFCGVSCHQGARGRSDTHPANVLHLSQPMDPTSLQGLYERLSLWWNSPSGSTAGTGVLENGTEDSVFANQGVTDDMIAYMVSFEGPIDGRTEVSGSVHAGVGVQAMLTRAGLAAESPPVCAPENGTCKVTGGIREVIFGAKGTYVSGVFSGPASCNDATFGDPLYGVVKSCAMRGAPLTSCATQGGTCVVSGLSEVFYSTGSGPAEVLVTRANTPCVAASFAAPAGTSGSCYVRPAREWSRVMTLLQLAQNGEVGLVYQTSVAGVPHGGYYLGAGVFQTDSILTQATLQNLYTWVANGQSVQLTLVPRGTEYRIGVDANLNGRLNGDELAGGANPRAQSAGVWTECASDGGVCSFSGTHVVRYGQNGTYTYYVATSSVVCSTTVFGDPVDNVTRECDVAN